MRKIEALEKEVFAFVQEQAEHEGEERDAGDEERDVRSHRDDDGGSDDEGDEEGDDEDGGSGMGEDEVEDRFREFEDEVAVLVADVHDLALFTKLNFTGFQKIVKKHDVSGHFVSIIHVSVADWQKITGFQLKQRFNKEYLEQHPFYRINYDHLIVKLSKLFDLVRTRGHPVEGDASAGGSQNAFVRSTTKYWVGPLR